VKSSITVTVGAIASKILAVELVTRGNSSSQTAERAIRAYLNDGAEPGPGWAYPSFLRGRKPVDGVRLRLDLDGELWHELSQEAAKQGVSDQQLLEHAVLYFAAEDHAGRVTERILEDLEEDPEKD
jgi:hypothetical protein